MKVQCAAFSETGPRERNEDAILVPRNLEGSHFVAAIADGIGGAPGGAEAASLALKAAAEFDYSAAPIDELFKRAVDAIKEAVIARPEFSRMGTTLSVASIGQAGVHVAHVGDTRVYHLRGRGLNTLTQDQTEVAELVRKGILSDRQAKRYPRKNVLLSALTAKGEYEVQHADAALEVGDRLLLLTDGVHQRLTRGAILKASLAFEDVQAFASELERLTDEAGPSDNYSAVALQIDA